MATFDPHHYPNPSRRTCTYASRGMVATSQPLAAQAGLDMLKRGGNAIDAALAAAISLTVLEPTSNGIGGDLYALVWTEGKLHGLNGSGPAPQSLSIEALRSRGYQTMPQYGIVPLTVPGAPASWAELSRRFGKLPFAELFEPAIQYAERGFPVSATLGALFEYEFAKFNRMEKGPEFEPLYTTFAPGGRYPATGDYVTYPHHGETLRSIAESNAESFYRGGLAQKIDAFIRTHGGYLTADDLAAYKPEWVEPIKVHYRGYDVWEIPPNGQGIVALMALNVLKRLAVTSRDDVEMVHKQIEAVKLAFADGFEHVTDCAKMKVTPAELLSDAYAEERAALIGDKAREPLAGQPPRGGTVYIAAADEQGHMVSLIQSNYMGFGSGVVIPDTGIAIQNRAADFALDASKANALAPGKKSFHTIIPGFLTKDGEAVGPFGIMGGFMQPQGHVQLMMNLLDFHMNPQAALDAPRWQWKQGMTVELEPGFPAHIAQALQRKGHHILCSPSSLSFGRGQIILRNPAGRGFVGGTEPRTDGHIAVW